MTNRTAYDWFTGAGGALIRIAGGLLVLMVVFVAGSLLWDFSVTMRIAMRRWANGDGLDLVGFATLLGSIGTLVGIVAPIVIANNRDRRLRDIAAVQANATPPPSPIPPSAPSSPAPAESPVGDGLVNNNAIS